MIHTVAQHSVRIIPWQARTAIKRIPLVSSLQRFLLSQFLEGREFAHQIDAGPGRGLTYPVVLPDDKGVWTGTYELTFVEALARATQPGSTCFDVGGWRGYCGGVMAMQDAGKVVIFEPLPGNCDRIQRLIELNPSLPIELVQAAAGESSGEATFTVMDATSMGKLVESPFQQGISTSESISVNVVSLDNWCQSNGVPFPNIMKIDVEGAEMMVLRGARRILTESGPTLFIEAHSRELAKQVVSYLEQMDYRIHVLETDQPIDGVTEPEVCHLVAQPASK